jgi:hypothetical protein
VYIIPLDNDDGTYNCNLYFPHFKVRVHVSGNKAVYTNIALKSVYRVSTVSKAVNSLQLQV